jgi:hypothetical protein
MGRPLNKKYFGNRNIGEARPSDDGIGGSKLASITVTAAGTYTAAHATALTATFPTPLVANGVTATGTPLFGVKTISVNATGTKAYQTGQAFSFGAGTTATVTTIANSVGNTIASTNGSNQVVFGSSAAYIPGMDFLTSASLTGSGLTAATRYWIVSGSGTTYSVASSYANAIAGTALTFGAGAVGSNGGVLVGTQAGPVATVTVVGTGTYAQSAITALVASPSATTTTTTPGGLGLTVTPATFGVNGATFTDVGDGYATGNSAQTLAVTFTGTSDGSAATANIVAAADDTTQAVGSFSNRENAILAWAYTGGNLVEVDLQKQISTKRYKFNKTGEVNRLGTEIARIKYTGIADGTSSYTAAQGVEMNIVATDVNGGTYLVRKLYNRTCTLYPLAINNSTIGITTNTAGTLYTQGQQVKWSFAAASTGVVQIQNA